MRSWDNSRAEVLPRNYGSATLFHHARGQILVIGAAREARFRTLNASGVFGEATLRIPRSGKVDNNGLVRVIGIPEGATHRFYWIKGPCAPSLDRLAQVDHPLIKRHVRWERRRQSLVALWHAIKGEA